MRERERSKEREEQGEDRRQHETERGNRETWVRLSRTFWPGSGKGETLGYREHSKLSVIFTCACE